MRRRKGASYVCAREVQVICKRSPSHVHERWKRGGRKHWYVAYTTAVLLRRLITVNQRKKSDQKKSSKRSKLHERWKRGARSCNTNKRHIISRSWSHGSGESCAIQRPCWGFWATFMAEGAHLYPPLPFLVFVFLGLFQSMLFSFACRFFSSFLTEAGSWRDDTPLFVANVVTKVGVGFFCFCCCCIVLGWVGLLYIPYLTYLTLTFCNLKTKIPNEC